MKKKLLFLTAWLLTGATCFNAYAQEVVNPEAIKNYDELKKVIENLNTAKDKNAKYLDAKEKYDAIKDLTNPNPETIEKTTPVTESGLTTITNPLVEILGNFTNSFYEEKNITPNTLCFRIRKVLMKKSTPVTYLYLTTSDLTGRINDMLKETEADDGSSYDKWAADDWTETDMNYILTTNNGNHTYSMGVEINNSMKYPKQMIVYYEKYDGYLGSEVDENNTVIKDNFSKTLVRETFDKAGEEYEYLTQIGWTDHFNTLIGNPSRYGLQISFNRKYNKIENVDNPAYTAWEEDYKTKKTNFENAEKAWNAITGGSEDLGKFYLNNESVCKIVSNIDYPTTGYDANLEWPAGRKLDGGNHMYTGTQEPLIKYNRGEIYNMIAPYTQLVTKNFDGYSFMSDCISKTSTGYTIERPNASDNTPKTLKAAVYQLRDKFGFNVETNKATGPADRTTKLYEAKYADAEHKDLYTFHVNLAEEDGVEAIKYDKAQAALDNRLASGIKRENTVIYINNADVPEDVKAWDNVAIRNNAETEKYTCENVKLVDGEKDGMATEEFYVHTGFAFKNIHYGRTFNQNMTALCLPFKLDAKVKAALEAKTGQTIWYYTFKEVRGKTMWFNVVDVVDANTPCIIAYTGELSTDKIFNELSLDGTTLPEFASTNGATLGATASNTGELCFFGNYKFGQFANNLSAISNGGKGACIYGFQDGALRLMPEAVENENGELVGPRLHQFRSYIRLEADLTGNTAAPNSFNIGFLDEDGNEVTGIGTVESGKNDSGVKAMGGNGVIELTAEKACEVKVYTASGSLVKAIRVEAGNTTLPLSAGVYVVNQTKVVVK